MRDSELNPLGRGGELRMARCQPETESLVSGNHAVQCRSLHKFSKEQNVAQAGLWVSAPEQALIAFQW